MRNAFIHFCLGCALLLVAGAATVRTAAAQDRELATVKFDRPVAIGSAVLPAGNYMITDTGTDAFLIQSEHGHAGAVVMGKRADAPNNAQTEAILKNDGENWRLDKLVLSEYSTVYNFIP